MATEVKDLSLDERALLADTYRRGGSFPAADAEAFYREAMTALVREGFFEGPVTSSTGWAEYLLTPAGNRLANAVRRESLR